MNVRHMSEAAIDASLDACLHGAREGDVHQARQLHDMLDRMLTGREAPEGKLWLTEHGKLLLAEMHRQLSHCEGKGEHFRDHVMNAVRFVPHHRAWKDTCSYVKDLRIAISVANELCEQRQAGLEPDVETAARTVAESGEVDLVPERICEIYGDIAETVGGFREFSRC